MGFRNPRPGPKRPATSGHKDESGLMGALGGLLGGAAGAGSAGADAASEPDIAGGESSSTSAGGSTGATAGQPNYASLLTKPGFLQNLLSGGRAGLGYQSTIGNLAAQQLAGGNQMALQQAQASSASSLSAQQAEQIRQQALSDANASLMKQAGFDPSNPQDQQDWASTEQARKFNADTNFKMQGNVSSLQANATDPTQNPNIQDAYNAGSRAVGAMPTADFYAKTKTEAPLGAKVFGELGYNNPVTGGGATGTSSSSIATKGMQKMPDGTMRAVDSNTTGTQFSGGGINAPVNLKNAAASFNQQTPDDNDIQEDDTDSQPLPMLQTKPTPMPSSGGLMDTLRTQGQMAFPGIFGSPTQNPTSPMSMQDVQQLIQRQSPVAYKQPQGPDITPQSLIQALQQLATKPQSAY